MSDMVFSISNWFLFMVSMSFFMLKFSVVSIKFLVVPTKFLENPYHHYSELYI